MDGVFSSIRERRALADVHLTVRSSPALRARARVLCAACRCRTFSISTGRAVHARRRRALRDVRALLAAVGRLVTPVAHAFMPAHANVDTLSMLLVAVDFSPDAGIHLVGARLGGPAGRTCASEIVDEVIARGAVRSGTATSSSRCRSPRTSRARTRSCTRTRGRSTWPRSGTGWTSTRQAQGSRCPPVCPCTPQRMCRCTRSHSECRCRRSGTATTRTRQRASRRYHRCNLTHRCTCTGREERISSCSNQYMYRRDDTHLSASASQLKPTYPAGHTHPYENTPSTHVAPLMHGYEEHSSKSTSQCVPAQPFAHVHVYVVVHAALMHLPSLHVAPFMHGDDVHSRMLRQVLPALDVS